MEIIDSLLMMLNEMSPYILLGLLVAGLLQVFVPARLMGRHLAGSGFKQVVKAALLGIPLPLCSCGVLPTAVALRRRGASRAASSSFLIATPQTGVDSIAATYGLLGPAFAVIRPVAALATALAGGSLVGAAERKMPPEAGMGSCDVSENVGAERRSFFSKLGEALRYGFFDLLRSIGVWLVVGLVIAALINVLVPVDFFASLGERPLLAMLAVVVVAVPMYVCATGSIPIAMSLMLKGLSPGTALVLLMAGPAANFASVGIISRSMGKRCAAVYIGSIIVGAIAFGLAVDYLFPREWFTLPLSAGACIHHGGATWFPTACSVVLVLLLAAAFIVPKFNKNTLRKRNMTQELFIKGMNCPHCQASVQKGIASLDGVKAVEIDLHKGLATIEGDVSLDAVAAKVRELGFDPVE